MVSRVPLWLSTGLDSALSFAFDTGLQQGRLLEYPIDSACFQKVSSRRGGHCLNVRHVNNTLTYQLTVVLGPLVVPFLARGLYYSVFGHTAAVGSLLGCDGNDAGDAIHWL